MNAYEKYKKLVLINVGAIAITILAMCFDRGDVKDFLTAYIEFVSVEVAYLLGKNAKPRKK